MVSRRETGKCALLPLGCFSSASLTFGRDQLRIRSELLSQAGKIAPLTEQYTSLAVAMQGWFSHHSNAVRYDYKLRADSRIVVPLGELKTNAYGRTKG